MPKSIKCRICGARSPRYGFGKRMAWLRRHRKRKHPKAHKESIEKALETKRKKGIINKGGGKVGKKKKTYKKKSTAKKAKRKGESLYKVKGGYRISRRKKRKKKR